MRLFVAARPSSEAVDDLWAATATPRRDGERIRWTPAEQLHLTLAFLGEVTDRQHAELERRLARAAGRHPPLMVALAGARRLGSRVLVMSVSGDRERLARLAASVSAAARRCALPVDERRFRPHVTVARARTGGDVRPTAAALADYQGPSWPVAEIVLVRSRLGAGAGGSAAHEIIAGWPLTGGARTWAASPGDGQR